MSYAIEKDIPATNDFVHGRYGGFPLLKMSIGDSFLTDTRLTGTQRSTIHGYGQRAGKKFMTRKEGDGNRVWRIK